MKSIIYSISNALVLIYITITSTTARSFHHVIEDAIDTYGKKHTKQQQPFGSDSIFNDIHNFSSRSKRAVNDACPVHPDTPVILNGKETYFDFDKNEPTPAPHAGDNDNNLSCPARFGDWWPGTSINLRAACPWTWMTFDTWKLVPGMEIYPRYVTEAKCLCEDCVNANSMSCKQLQTDYQFYGKTGCDGKKPVFQGAKLGITVGCYCAKG